MRAFKFITILVLIFVILVGISFAFNLGGLKWQEYFGSKQENVEREIWEETSSRVRGVTQEVSSSLREYNSTDSTIEKKAIANHLAESYSNFDPTNINDDLLRQFFKDCKYGTLKEVYN